MAIAGAAVLLVLGAASLAYVWMQPDPEPRLSNYVQITHDGQPKQIVGTDGSRLYLYLLSPDAQRMAEMLVAGGEPRKISILPSANITPLSLSPDGSQVLAMDGNGVPPRGPLWSLPILGGSPRRLGDLEAMDAAWSSDGKMLAYTNAGTLFVAKADGSESRKVVAMKDSFRMFRPVWSPDGSHVRFHATENLDFTTNRLWEVALDGTNLHRLLPENAISPGPQCCGSWTPDGRYFVFRHITQLWALPRKRGFLQSEPKPVQLTSNPLLMSSWILSKDGKKLFVVGQISRGELMRYVAKSGQFEPFLGGTSAEFPAFSKDGQWVTYVLFPEGTLWRSKVDGSERLQLTYPPGYSMMPRWSPDGKTIVFFESSPSKPSRIYEVSAEGGTPRELMPDIPGPQQDPIWSADGTKIMFGGDAGNSASSIRIFDLATHQVTTLPGSQGTFSPRWSPNGRYVPAFSSDSTRLLLFDFQTQQWTELAKGSFGWVNFSKNGQYSKSSTAAERHPFVAFVSATARRTDRRSQEFRTPRPLRQLLVDRAGRFTADAPQRRLRGCLFARLGEQVMRNIRLAISPTCDRTRHNGSTVGRKRRHPWHLAQPETGRKNRCLQVRQRLLRQDRVAEESHLCRWVDCGHARHTQNGYEESRCGAQENASAWDCRSWIASSSRRQPVEERQDLRSRQRQDLQRQSHTGIERPIGPARLRRRLAASGAPRSGRAPTNNRSARTEGHFPTHCLIIW